MKRNRVTHKCNCIFASTHWKPQMSFKIHINGKIILGSMKKMELQGNCHFKRQPHRYWEQIISSMQENMHDYPWLTFQPTVKEIINSPLLFITITCWWDTWEAFRGNIGHKYLHKLFNVSQAWIALEGYIGRNGFLTLYLHRPCFRAIRSCGVHLVLCTTWLLWGGT